MKLSILKFTTLALFGAVSLSAGNSASATYPAGYYDKLNGKCGAALMTAIKDLCINHTAISYSSGTWNAFKDTDVKTIDGVDYWWDMYSNDLVKVSSGHPGLNVEHSVPNSWWGGSKNDAYKDLAHLNPSESTANNRKANYPLAELKTVKWTNGVTSVGTPKDGQGGGNDWAFEPLDEYKGDFARAYMYMFTVYKDISWRSTCNWMYLTTRDLMFKDWAQIMLCDWNAKDPVSKKERDRNDGIYKHQKNRNPFIDLPDLAEHIWGSKKTVPFKVEGAPDPIDPDDPETPDESTTLWLAETSSSLDEGWEFEDLTLPEGSTYVWSWKQNSGKYYLNASGYIGGTAKEAESYAWAPEVSLAKALAANVSFEHAAKFQTTCASLCKFAVRDAESGEITEFDITTWPAKGNWTFTSSERFDLMEFAGKKVNLGFKYASTPAGADTWEIRNMKFYLKSSPSAIELPTEDVEDDSMLVDVIGNCIIAPEGARIFDLNGREVSGDNVAPGVYIVAKPSFGKSVKVLVK
ncbi:MAG: endonuclease [Muribaculaceae bacterium]|nr:endonuclease [Muribaculaceae bacterium]